MKKIQKTAWAVGTALLMAGVAQAALVYSQDFDSLAFTTIDKVGGILGGASANVVAGEWSAANDSVTIGSGTLDIASLPKNRYRAASVWLDTTGWAAGTVTVAFDVSDYTAGVNGTAVFNAFSATGVDGSNDAIADIHEGAGGIVLNGTATSAVFSTETIAGNGAQNFTFNYAGTEDFIGFAIGAVVASVTGDTGPAFSVDNLSVTTIPEPATLGVVVAFGGAMLFVRRIILI